jgi:hypothetical protein
MFGYKQTHTTTYAHCIQTNLQLYLDNERSWEVVEDHETLSVAGTSLDHYGTSTQEATKIISEVRLLGWFQKLNPGPAAGTTASKPNELRLVLPHRACCQLLFKPP